MPLVLRLERKVRRSPDEATAACAPQVVQNASLPELKEGGGSLAKCSVRRTSLTLQWCVPSWMPTEGGGASQTIL
jgi:hypothetical protein